MESSRIENPMDILEGKLADINFMTSHSNNYYYGSIRIPQRFNCIFGKKLNHKEVKVICNEGNIWEGVYFEENGDIEGLDEYFDHHRIKMHTLLYIEFYKPNKFVMSICLPHGVQANFKSNEKALCYPEKKVKAVTEENSESELEVQNSKALLLLIGYGIQRTYDISIQNSYLTSVFQRLILDIDYFELYEQWISGEKIKFLLGNQTWEIQIHRGCRGQFCSLGEGWHKFVHDLKFEDGDSLILYEGHARNEVQFCFLRRDMRKRHIPPKSMKEYKTCFYHFVSEVSQESGQIIIPKEFVNTFAGFLRNTVSLRWYHNSWTFALLRLGKDRLDIRRLLPVLKVQNNDTILFIFNSNGEGTLKLFHKDGMEVYYINYRETIDYIDLNHWYINSEWSEAVETDLNDSSDESMGSSLEMEGSEVMEFNGFQEVVDQPQNIVVNQIGENGHRVLAEFNLTLRESHLNGHGHGAYIKREIQKRNGVWENGDEVVLNFYGRRWPVGVLKNGSTPRLSGRWNDFVELNRMEEDDVLTFQYLDTENPEFLVTIVRHD